MGLLTKIANLEEFDKYEEGVENHHNNWRTYQSWDVQKDKDNLIKTIIAKIREVVEGAELTNDELYQCSLLSEDDCKEIEELHKSYGDDIFYGEDDFARHRFAGDIVVRRKITQAHTKAILKAIEED